MENNHVYIFVFGYVKGIHIHTIIYLCLRTLKFIHLSLMMNESDRIYIRDCVNTYLHGWLPVPSPVLIGAQILMLALTQIQVPHFSLSSCSTGSAPLTYLCPRLYMILYPLVLR